MNQRLLIDNLWEEVHDAHNGVMCVRLLADLDLATENAARARMARLCRDEAVRCVLLMAGSDRFVGLRGLDLLIDASARMRRRGRSLVVVDPPVSLRLMIEGLGLREPVLLTATARQAMALVGVACASR